MFQLNFPYRTACFAAFLVLGACGQSSNSSAFVDPATSRLTKSINTAFDESGFSEIYFGYGKTSLTAQARTQLNNVAKFIVRNPQARFNVIGYADATGSEDYNRKLGLKRAQTAAAYLIGRGVSFQQLEATSSLGEGELRVQTDQRSVLNRRVVIEVFDMLDQPVRYESANGRFVPVDPRTAINSTEAVCSGGSLAGACASAGLLGLMNLDANAKVSRKLRISLGLEGHIHPRKPTGAANVDAIGHVGSTVTSATGSVSSSVGGLLGG